jgi:hypothetical protein
MCGLGERGVFLASVLLTERNRENPVMSLGGVDPFHIEAGAADTFELFSQGDPLASPGIFGKRIDDMPS